MGGWWQLKWGGNRARQTTARARTHHMATVPLSWGRGSPQNEPQVPHTTGQHRPRAQRGSHTLTGPSHAPHTQHFLSHFFLIYKFSRRWLQLLGSQARGTSPLSPDVALVRPQLPPAPRKEEAGREVSGISRGQDVREQARVAQGMATFGLGQDFCMERVGNGSVGWCTQCAGLWFCFLSQNPSCWGWRSPQGPSISSVLQQPPELPLFLLFRRN